MKRNLVGELAPFEKLMGWVLNGGMSVEAFADVYVSVFPVLPRKLPGELEDMITQVWRLADDLPRRGEEDFPDEAGAQALLTCGLIARSATHRCLPKATLILWAIQVSGTALQQWALYQGRMDEEMLFFSIPIMLIATPASVVLAVLFVRAPMGLKA
jgi:hypothetical protein